MLIYIVGGLCLFCFLGALYLILTLDDSKSIIYSLNRVTLDTLSQIVVNTTSWVAYSEEITIPILKRYNPPL